MRIRSHQPTTHRFGAVALALLCTAATGVAQVIRVPANHATIQAALNAAPAGALIEVSAGTYAENLIWPGRDIDLVAVDGPANTTIDAGRRGRVVQFGRGLTRATRIEGFTLVRGDDRMGAGIYTESSVTIVRNVIRQCVGRDPIANEGAGIYVASGSPMIRDNTIVGCELRNGTCRGAGIFVETGAAPVIRANTIAGNQVVGAQSAFGGGIFCDVAGTPSPTLYSNLIQGNSLFGVAVARGGAIAVAGGRVTIVGNTIAQNAAGSGTAAYGGGIALDGTPTGTTVVNNILTGNSVLAISGNGGGIHCASAAAALTIDYNCVWNNVGLDYFGCAPGANDISVDPRYRGTNDLRLSGTSPCIDRGSTAFGGGSTDVEGDPRWLDGDLDGTVSADIGADEYGVGRLVVGGANFPGGTATIDVFGPAGTAYSLGLSLRPLNVPINPFGALLIAPPIAVVARGVTPAQTQLSIPGSVSLVGVRVYTQALLTAQSGSRTVGQFTNRGEIRMVERFTNPIVENFATTQQLDPSSTAAWGGAAPGLRATLGFGGNGIDGPLDVATTQTLDSSTRAPNAAGVVEWHFSSVNIRPTGRLLLTGPYPIRILVAGNCTVDGTIDARGQNGANGVPGTAGAVGRLPGGIGGPGGGQGGDANTKPNSNPLGALPLDLRGGPGRPRATVDCNQVNSSENFPLIVFQINCGGGTGGNRGVPSGTLLRSGCSGNGGGHATPGERTDFRCSNVGAFGLSFGDQWVIPSGSSQTTDVSAGSGGGAGGNAATTTGQTPLPSQDIVAGAGGGGGGGVEIVAANRLVVNGTVRADGGNGGVGHTVSVGILTVAAGFGGGGAGGSIWMTGGTVTVGAGATMSALGGIGNPSPPVVTQGGKGGDGYTVVRDLSGLPTVNGTVTPVPEATRSLYQPANAGTSVALSKFYGTRLTNPQWVFDANNPSTGQVTAGTDLTFAVPPGAGQNVVIQFQGAPDVNGQPDPNPANWFPAGNAFANDITQLRGRGLRWIRFRVQFTVPSTTPPSAAFPTISMLRIRY